MRGHPNVLDQAARGALRTQSRQDAELEAADDGAVALLGDHELNAWIVIDGLERVEVAGRQRMLDLLAAAAERIIR